MTQFADHNNLPLTLRPLSYNIWIKPYFPAPGISYNPEKEFTFEGRASINVEATADSPRFAFFARRLNISSYRVIDSSGNLVSVHLKYPTDESRLYLIMDSGVATNTSIYTIQMNYTGQISTKKDYGMFSSTFDDLEGMKRFVVATHMQPKGSSKVFPSLHTPYYKSNFTIELEYPTSQVALSNMEKISQVDHGNGWSTVKFPPTPPMSAYLVAIVIGPYVYSEYVNKHNTSSRVWGWRGTEASLGNIAETAGECLYQLGEYTGIKYPFEKLDHVGVPDFLPIAMENWGLIIYKYRNFFYDKETVTTSDLVSFNSILCHEIAHQWFGNLVTPSSWTDIFLNEGFSTYFSNFALKMVYPEQSTYFDSYDSWTNVQNALFVDSKLELTQPLITRNGEFDVSIITYKKGAALVRLLSGVLGPEVLRQGIRNYLRINQYGSVTIEDLFSELTKVARQNGITGWCGSSLNVTEFMRPYLYEVGFPIVRINMGTTENSAYFIQETIKGQQNNPGWKFPLTVRSFNNSNHTNTIWITEENCSQKSTDQTGKLDLELGLVESPYYGRIVYDDVSFSRLIEYVARNDIEDDIKINLLGDEAFNVQTNNASNERYSKLAKTIFTTPSSIENPSGPVFESALGLLGRSSAALEIIFGETRFQNAFSEVYANLFWNGGGSWAKNAFLDNFLPFAVHFNIGDVEQRTMRKFENIKEACENSINGTSWCNPYSPDIRHGIYCGASKFSSDAFSFLENAFKNESKSNPYYSHELEALMIGMGCTNSIVHQKKIIQLVPMDLFVQVLQKYPIHSFSIFNAIIVQKSKEKALKESKDRKLLRKNLMENWSSVTTSKSRENIQY